MRRLDGDQAAMMNDVRDESRTHPRPFPLKDYRRLLILAPHPDDEVYGCGGLLARARECGIESTALILTDGSGGAADPALTEQRRAESLAAATLLGHHVEFGAFTDRALRLDQALTEAIAAACARYQPDLVLAPCFDDPHPDHQAVALAAIQVLGCAPHKADLAFYETNGGLTHVTHVLDVSSCYESKRAAMQCFVSQERQLPYARRIEARDGFRAFTLGPETASAEAFFLAPLRAKGFSALLPALDPLYRHGHLAAAAHPAEAPLVSVLIRSIGDPLLEQAVASVLAQSHRPLEIVIVAAHAHDVLSDFPHLSACPLIRQLVPATPLERPAAANAALLAAKGRYLLFLDDDDLLLPDHLEKLVTALRAHPEALAAHAAVVVQDPAGNTLRHYAYEVTPERLLATNLLPIHAVLFDRRLIDEHVCRFDETLPRLEDWDFWLQVAQHTGFVPVKGTSAIYRYRDRTGLCRPDTQADQATQALHLRILAQWRNRLGDAPFDVALAWHARTLDEVEQRLDASALQASERAKLLQMAHEEITALNSEHAKLLQMAHEEIAALNQSHENDRRVEALAAQTLEQVFGSTSWRLTAPLRWLVQQVRRRQ